MNPGEYGRMFAVEDSHFWYRGMRAMCDRLLGPVTGARDLRILDAGCGTGGNAVWLGERGAVTAVDVAPEGLTLCRERGLRQLCRASVAALPFADGVFDLVTSFDVLEHRAVLREADAVAEMARVLAPGGWLLVRVPAFRFLLGPHDAATHSVRRYRLPEVVALLRGAGLEVRHATYVNALLWPATALWRLGRRLPFLVGQGESKQARDADAVSDVRAMPALADRVLGLAMRAEARLLPRFRFPVGLSVLALAERPRF